MNSAHMLGKEDSFSIPNTLVSPEKPDCLTQLVGTLQPACAKLEVLSGCQLAGPPARDPEAKLEVEGGLLIFCSRGALQNRVPSASL